VQPQLRRSSSMCKGRRSTMKTSSLNRRVSARRHERMSRAQAVHRAPGIAQSACAAPCVVSKPQHGVHMCCRDRERAARSCVCLPTGRPCPNATGMTVDAACEDAARPSPVSPKPGRALPAAGGDTHRSSCARRRTRGCNQAQSRENAAFPDQRTHALAPRMRHKPPAGLLPP